MSFYRDTLMLPCRIIADEWAAITVGDAEIHLYLNGGVSGHVEFYVEDIEKEVKRLQSKGVIFISGMEKPGAISMDEHFITSFPWGRTAFFKDSEENELAIVRDNTSGS